jgi:thiamine-monophosphate kinase
VAGVALGPLSYVRWDMDLKEFDFIYKYLKPKQASRALVGVGDDASVIHPDGRTSVLQCTDVLIEDVHFRLSQISFKDLGYKSLAVNISDLAAMGARPRWAHLCLGVPSHVKQKQLIEFVGGFQRLARAQGIELIGGDLSHSPQSLFVSIHLTGFAKKNKIALRSNFTQADLLCVTGPLGDSSLGFWCLENKRKDKVCSYFVKKHFRPPILVNEGEFLANHKAVSGVMDISDGLLSDIQHTHNHWRVEVTQLPLSKQLKSYCQQAQLDPYDFALGGGEDYQLLVGVKADQWESLQRDYKKRFNKSLHPIAEKWLQSRSKKQKGSTNKKDNKYKGATQYLRNGVAWEPKIKAFSHFS